MAPAMTTERLRKDERLGVALKQAFDPTGRGTRCCYGLQTQHDIATQLCAWVETTTVLLDIDSTKRDLKKILVAPSIAKRNQA